MNHETQTYGCIFQIDYFVVFTASGFQFVMLSPNSVKVHANRSCHALTQEIRTNKTFTEYKKFCCDSINNVIQKRCQML